MPGDGEIYLPQEVQEKAPDKLDQQMSKVRVLSSDIAYLMTRARAGTLSSIVEHLEVQEEIHDLQRILADWESYIGSEIAKKAAEYAVNGIAATIKMQTGVRS